MPTKPSELKRLEHRLQTVKNHLAVMRHHEQQREHRRKLLGKRYIPSSGTTTVDLEEQFSRLVEFLQNRIAEEKKLLEAG